MMLPLPTAHCPLALVVLALAADPKEGCVPFGAAQVGHYSLGAHSGASTPLGSSHDPITHHAMPGLGLWQGETPTVAARPLPRVS